MFSGPNFESDLNVIMLMKVYLFGILVVATSSSKNQQAPVFIQEPPAQVDFSNSTGHVIPCSAQGSPASVVSWVSTDGPSGSNPSLASDIPGLRHVRPDGSLVFTPFRADDFRQDIHATTYRCLAKNAAGVTGSRNVRVRGVVQQSYVVEVYDEFVIVGNTAVLRCHIPGFVKEFLTVTSWIQDGSYVIPATPLSGDRFSVFTSGELHVRRVEMSDGEKRYQCQTRHRLTGEIMTSVTAGRIVVNEPFTNMMPRLTDIRNQLQVREGEAVEIPCAAQGLPVPSYTWYKKEGPRLHPVTLNQRWMQLDGTLVIQQSTVQDSGQHVCVVNNSMGSDSGPTDLLVTAPLSVRVEPKHQTIDVGSSAMFNCTHSGYPILSVEWYKDQQSLRGGGRVRFPTRLSLQISSVQREDAGVYQCYVHNKDESAQGAGQLSLGEDAPSLLTTFPSQVTQPGPSLSLKCIASGNPLPQVTWTLDGTPIPEGSRFRMGDYVKSDATVVSYVNISSVQPEDGGTYSCKATNDVGMVLHEAKIAVFGPPFIRRMSNLTVVAGTAMKIQCPVGGHPIDTITWEREGLRLPYNHRQRVSPNGTLVVQYVERATDEGKYACLARNSDGQVAQQTIFITVTVQPYIEPFSFPKSLHQGQRYTVLCSVTRGDPPIVMTWLKDGRKIREGNGGTDGVHSVAVTEFSSTLVFESVRPEHRGNYSCAATNAGGIASHHATMVIHVPPRWKIEPETTFVVQGSTLLLDCQAEGFPLPRIRWSKAQAPLEESEFKPISSSSRVHVFENGTLALQNAEKTDVGTYLCQASNGIGSGLSKVIQIAVKVAVHFESKFAAETVRKGEDAKLKCQAIGDKPVAIAWFKDKQQFDPSTDPRYETKETILSHGVTSEVIIQRADRRDSALFTCVAKNAFGEEDTNIQLIMQEPPDAPQDVKIAEYTSRTARLTWIPPYSGNSPVLEYMVQYKTENDKWHLRAFNASVPGSEPSVVIKGLSPVTAYNFRVTAINHLGRSDYSAVTFVKTDEEAPGGPPLKAKAQATGSQSLKVSWKPPRKDLHFGEIKGYYVGYKISGSAETYVYKTLIETERQSQGDQCHLTNLRRYSKYSIIVQAYNSQGAGPPSDEIIVQTLENDPPRSPALKLSSSTPSSIRLTWEMDKTETNPVTGFFLHTKKDYGEWSETKLPGESRQYVVSHLQCGTKHQFYLTAFNSIGKGEPSEIFTAKTDGMAPMAPDKQSLLSVNISSVQLRFDSWHDGGCPIQGFSVKYKLQRHKTWTLAAANLPGVTKQYVVTGLNSGTWYQVQVTAHNEAGTMEAEYSFVTLSKDKEPGPPATVQESAGVPFYLDMNVILPAVVSFVVVISVVVFVCVILRRRRSSESHTGIYASRKTQPPHSNHDGTGLYYPTPYATTDIGSDHPDDMNDVSLKQQLQDEPLYATVKRTPRPPRSDLHIYHYPDDLRAVVAEWKETIHERPEECDETSMTVSGVRGSLTNGGGSRRLKYSGR